MATTRFDFDDDQLVCIQFTEGAARKDFCGALKDFFKQHPLPTVKLCKMTVLFDTEPNHAN